MKRRLARNLAGNSDDLWNLVRSHFSFPAQVRPPQPGISAATTTTMNKRLFCFDIVALWPSNLHHHQRLFKLLPDSFCCLIYEARGSAASVSIHHHYPIRVERSIFITFKVKRNVPRLLIVFSALEPVTTLWRPILFLLFSGVREGALWAWRIHFVQVHFICADTRFSVVNLRNTILAHPFIVSTISTLHKMYFTSGKEVFH